MVDAIQATFLRIDWRTAVLLSSSVARLMRKSESQESLVVSVFLAGRVLLLIDTQHWRALH
jgi:hypothetical protein